MITIQTVACKIQNADGTGANGSLIISPSEAFEFLESSSPTKRKVSIEPIQVPITDGVINAFSIAPTVNASQDKSNLYFIARFFTETADWTEYWQIDGGGAAALEINDVARVEVDITDITDPTLNADDVSATPTANLVPRADGTGKLAAGWLPSISGSYPAVYVQATEPSPAPASNAIAFWIDTSVNQVKVWDGTTWRTFA